MVVNNNSEFWKNIINNIDAEDLPESGLSAPEVEKKPIRSRKSINNNKVMVHKITTVFYVMTDLDNRKYASSSNQTMTILGEMSLEQALKMANMEFNKDG